MINQRRHDRFKKSIKSEVHFEEGMTFSTSRNLSHGGVFISTPEPLREGRIIDLFLYLPQEDPVRVKGIVRWVSESDSPASRAGMGIEFLNASESDYRRIRGSLES